MEFRRAVKPDISSIMMIIKQAQDYFKKQGINQWQNNYPNLNIILNDINSNNGYALLKNNIVIGTVAVVFDGEKTYEHIYNGKWESNNEYAVIHRIAVAAEYKGLGMASVILKNVEDMCLRKGITSIRIDTHEKNRAMQSLLDKNQFNYCGIIYLEDNSERLAYEKIL